MENVPNLLKAVANVVTRHREEQGLSKRKLAELAQIDRVYLLQIEQGKYRLTLNALFLLANGLGMQPSELVAHIEEELKANIRQLP